jgi:hypothetical protein
VTAAFLQASVVLQHQGYYHVDMHIAAQMQQMLGCQVQSKLLLIRCSQSFAQVLHTLNLAEGYRAGEQRNILQVRKQAKNLHIAALDSQLFVVCSKHTLQ